MWPVNLVSLTNVHIDTVLPVVLSFKSIVLITVVSTIAFNEFTAILDTAQIYSTIPSSGVTSETSILQLPFTIRESFQDDCYDSPSSSVTTLADVVMRPKRTTPNLQLLKDAFDRWVLRPKKKFDIEESSGSGGDVLCCGSNQSNLIFYGTVF